MFFKIKFDDVVVVVVDVVVFDVVVEDADESVALAAIFYHEVDHCIYYLV